MVVFSRASFWGGLTDENCSVWGSILQSPKGDTLQPR